MFFLETSENVASKSSSCIYSKLCLQSCNNYPDSGSSERQKGWNNRSSWNLSLKNLHAWLIYFLAPARSRSLYITNVKPRHEDKRMFAVQCLMHFFSVTLSTNELSQKVVDTKSSITLQIHLLVLHSYQLQWSFCWLVWWRWTCAIRTTMLQICQMWSSCNSEACSRLGVLLSLPALLKASWVAKNITVAQNHADPSSSTAGNLHGDGFWPGGAGKHVA